MRVENLLTQNALRHRSRLLLSTGSTQRTYADVDVRSNKIANFLSSRSSGPGERVAVILPNGVELVELMFAAAKANTVLVPINPSLSYAESQMILDDCAARVVVSTADVVDALADEVVSDTLLVTIGPQRPPTGGVAQGRIAYEDILRSASAAWQPSGHRSDLDIWLLGYTSGTTGRPKGACLSHRAKTLCSVVEVVEFGTSGTDRALINTPMFHAHALVNILMLTSVGGSILIADRFDAEQTLRLVAEQRITELSMVPTMYRRVLAATGGRSVDLSSIRVARSTGARLSPDLGAEIQEVFGADSLHVLYGATEAGPVSNLRSDLFGEKSDSVGLPFLGVDVEARDADGMTLEPGRTGEVFVRSPYIFSGYHGSDWRSAGGGYERWITLGDLGTVDADGFLFLYGRSGDVIISGGENVSAREIEDTLTLHPAVTEAAVIGVPDEDWGERVKAFIEPTPGATVTLESLAVFCSERLAGYKRPKEFEVVSSLPRNAMGKVDKKSLKAGGRSLA